LQVQSPSFELLSTLTASTPHLILAQGSGSDQVIVFLDMAEWQDVMRKKVTLLLRKIAQNLPNVLKFWAISTT